MTKKVAITVWNGIVSPLFDSAENLMTFTETGSVESVKCSGLSLMEKVDKIKKNSVDIVICGAISCLAEVLLTDNGIGLISGIRGEIEFVIAAYNGGTLESQSRFCFPGRCCRHGKRGARGKHNRGGTI